MSWEKQEKRVWGHHHRDLNKRWTEIALPNNSSSTELRWLLWVLTASTSFFLSFETESRKQVPRVSIVGSHDDDDGIARPNFYRGNEIESHESRETAGRMLFSCHTSQEKCWRRKNVCTFDDAPPVVSSPHSLSLCVNQTRWPVISKNNTRKTTLYFPPSFKARRVRRWQDMSCLSRSENRQQNKRRHVQLEGQRETSLLLVLEKERKKSPHEEQSKTREGRESREPDEQGLIVRGRLDRRRKEHSAKMYLRCMCRTREDQSVFE